MLHSHCFLLVVIGDCLNTVPLCFFKNTSILSGILIAHNMALLMNDVHKIYYHTHALQQFAWHRAIFHTLTIW